MKGAARENRPPPGVEKSMLNFEKKRIGENLRKLGIAIKGYKFALVAFLIPLGIRAIPEILVGPYPWAGTPSHSTSPTH